MKQEDQPEPTLHLSDSGCETQYSEDTCKQDTCKLELPLPATSASSDSPIRPWAAHFSYHLEDDLLAFVLYLTAFATGVLDATTYADFRTFASNQTG